MFILSEWIIFEFNTNKSCEVQVLSLRSVYFVCKTGNVEEYVFVHVVNMLYCYILWCIVLLLFIVGEFINKASSEHICNQEFINKASTRLRSVYIIVLILQCWHWSKRVWSVNKNFLFIFQPRVLFCINQSNQQLDIFYLKL